MAPALCRPPATPDHLRDAGEIGQLDADPPVMDRQIHYLAAGVEELAENVADHTDIAQPADVGVAQVSRLHDRRVQGRSAHPDQGLPDPAGLVSPCWMVDSAFIATASCGVDATIGDGMIVAVVTSDSAVLSPFDDSRVCR